MTPETPITISYPGNGLDNDIETTWGAFVADNDDAEMVADVAAQIAEHNYARIGGGASPEIWVFA